MSHWIVIRTDHRKEAYVASQAELRGFTAWVPMQIIAARPQVARKLTAKAHASVIRHIPVLPRRVFVQMPSGFNTEAVQADLGKIRHMVAVERNGALEAVSVASGAIEVFRAEIDRMNTAALALATKPTRKDKAKWKSLKEGLEEAIAMGKQQMEVAA